MAKSKRRAKPKGSLFGRASSAYTKKSGMFAKASEPYTGRRGKGSYYQQGDDEYFTLRR